ncbi:MAG: hypothetical protein RIG68_13130 [Imperialibacter sp.]|uniref:hypothetical protein n=1 Tax=Imperialibacter sp. TaxID=2038411 RepID=UPI0032EAB12E
MGTIIIRGTTPDYNYGKLRIYLDDKNIGYAYPNGVEQFEIEDGNHKVYLKTWWLKSSVVDFSLSDTAVFEMGFNRMLIMINAIVMLISFFGYMIMAANKIPNSKWMLSIGLVVYLSTFFIPGLRFVFIRKK